MFFNLYIRIRSKDKKHKTPFCVHIETRISSCVKVVEPALQLFCWLFRSPLDGKRRASYYVLNPFLKSFIFQKKQNSCNSIALLDIMTMCTSDSIMLSPSKNCQQVSLDFEK